MSTGTLRDTVNGNGTQDSLAGPYAATDRPDWQLFARERDDEHARLQLDLKARRDDLHRAGDELSTAMENDPKIRDTWFHQELREGLKAEDSASSRRMTQAVNAATAELDRRAEMVDDKAAEAWKTGQLRVGIVAASVAYEMAKIELAENNNLQLSVDRSAGHLRDAGLQLLDGMSRDPQWRGTAAEAELQVALQEDLARRHPDRLSLAVRDVVEKLDHQAHEGTAAGQMWQDSDLRKQVVDRLNEFIHDQGDLDTARRQAAAERRIMSRDPQWRGLEFARRQAAAEREIESQQKAALDEAPPWRVAVDSKCATREGRIGLTKAVLSMLDDDPRFGGMYVQVPLLSPEGEVLIFDGFGSSSLDDPEPWSQIDISQAELLAFFPAGIDLEPSTLTPLMRNDATEAWWVRNQQELNRQGGRTPILLIPADEFAEATGHNVNLDMSEYADDDRSPSP